MRKKSLAVLTILLLAFIMLFAACGGENGDYTAEPYHPEPEYAIDMFEEPTTDPPPTIIEEPTDNPPADDIKRPQNAASISVAHGQNLAIMADGSLWSWGESGWEYYSNPGNGTGEIQRVPIQIMDNVVHAAAGPHHSFAITTNGGMYAWGGNYFGSVGDGTTQMRLSPVRVLDDVIYAAMPLGVPDSHFGYVGARTYAIRSDNSLWAWGNGDVREWSVALGDGGETSQHSPVQIMENVRAVIPTSRGGFAITNDDVLWQWHGIGWMASPDDGSTIQTPAQLYPAPIMENVASISSCGRLVITTDNELFSLGVFSHETEPQYVMSGVAYATQYGRSFFVITTEANLYAWGENRLASHWRSGPTLGDGTTIDRVAPVRVLDDIAQVLAVGNTVYALGRDGTLWGWGNFGAAWGGNILLGDGSEFVQPDNINELLEDAYTYEPDRTFPSGMRWLLPDYADTGLRLSPVKIMENVAQVAATYYMFDHGWIRSFRAFAITTNGELWAWGANDDFDRGFSLLGDGASERRVYPVRVVYGE